MAAPEKPPSRAAVLLPPIGSRLRISFSGLVNASQRFHIFAQLSSLLRCGVEPLPCPTLELCSLLLERLEHLHYPLPRRLLKGVQDLLREVSEGWVFARGVQGLFGVLGGVDAVNSVQNTIVTKKSVADVLTGGN